jgi:hypothetical protein
VFLTLTNQIKGNFQVVAWDLDTTGRRLIDEICQVTMSKNHISH